MKKLILILIPILMLQSMAFGSSVNALKALIDDYHFALTVEWDQKDKAQLEAIQSQFGRELKSLQTQNIITPKDIKLAFKDSGMNEAELDALLLTNNSAELLALIDQKRQEMYDRGASWSPGAVFGVGLGILFVLEIVVLALKNSECPHEGNYPEGVRYDCVWVD